MPSLLAYRVLGGTNTGLVPPQAPRPDPAARTAASARRRPRYFQLHHAGARTDLSAAGPGDRSAMACALQRRGDLVRNLHRLPEVPCAHDQALVSHPVPIYARSRSSARPSGISTRATRSSACRTAASAARCISSTRRHWRGVGRRLPGSPAEYPGAPSIWGSFAVPRVAVLGALESCARQAQAGRRRLQRLWREQRSRGPRVAGGARGVTRAHALALVRPFCLGAMNVQIQAFAAIRNRGAVGLDRAGVAERRERALLHCRGARPQSRLQPHPHRAATRQGSRRADYIEYFSSSRRRA